MKVRAASRWLPCALVLVVLAASLPTPASAGTETVTVARFGSGGNTTSLYFGSCQSASNSTTVKVPFDANVSLAYLTISSPDNLDSKNGWVRVDVGNDGSVEDNATLDSNTSSQNTNLTSASWNDYVALQNLSIGNVSVPLLVTSCPPSGGWNITLSSLAVTYSHPTSSNTSAPSFSGPIPDLSLQQNRTNANLVYLPNYFYDADGDALNYSLVQANASDPGWSNVTASFNGSYLGFAASNSWTGNLSFHVDATDPANQTASSNNITLEVYQNRPPSFNGTLSDYTVTVNLTRTAYANLWSYFVDPDYNETFSFSVVRVNASDPGWANVTVNVSLGYFVFSSSNGWMGDLSFRVRATDSGGAWAESNNVTLTVRANEAPVFAGLTPDVVVAINGSTSASSSYFTEPDSEPMTITFVKSAPNASGWANVTVTGFNGSQNLSAGFFFVYASAGWSGTLSGSLRATDTSGLSTDGNEFDIIVNARPTTNGSIPDQTIVRGTTSYGAVNLSLYFDDAEGDALTFLAYHYYTGNNTTTPVVLAINGSYLDIGSSHATWTGTDSFYVVACDAFSRCAYSNVFTVDVIVQPNRAPVFTGSLSDINVIQGQSNLSAYDVGPSFSDADGDSLLFGVARVDANATGWLYLSIVWNGSRVGVRSSSTSWAGTVDLAVSARDPSSLYAWSNNFTIHVLARDLRPTFTGPIDNLTLQVGGRLSDALDADDYFTDPNGLPLTYAAVNASSSEGWNYTSLSWNGSRLTASNDGSSSWTGTLCFDVRATDVNGSTISSNEVCVRVVAPSNAPPAPSQPLPALRVEAGSSGEVLVDLSQFFSDDQFANELTFDIIKGSEPAWSEVNASVSGTALTVTFDGPVAPTNLTLYIVVTDAWGASYTSPPVRLEVAPNPSNRPPQIAGPGSLTLSLGTSVSVAVPAFDEDGDALTWTAVSSAPGLSVILDPLTETLTLSASGLDERLPYEAVVWVTDSWGATAELRVPVVVWNPSRLPTIALSLSADRAGNAWMNGTVTLGVQPSASTAIFATVSITSVGGPPLRAPVVDGRFALAWPQGLPAGLHSVTVTVTDGYGRVGTENALLTVPDPLPPVPVLLGILLNGATPGEIDPGSTFSLNLLASTSVPSGVTVEWFLDGNKVGEGATLTGLSAAPGSHTLEARASNGEVTRTVSASFTVRAPSQTPVETAAPAFPPVLTVAVLATLVVGLAFGLTQRGQYLLFAGLIGSIFARLKRESLLDHFIRGRLYQVISDEPGIHLAELRRRTHTAHGTAIHHLHILEKGGYIRAEPSGTVTRFHTTDQPFEHEAYGITDGDRAVLSVVAEDPGITQGELSSRLGRSPSAVSRSVSRLNNLGYVTTEQKGRYVSVYPRPGAVIEGDSAGGGWQDEHP